MVSQKSTPGSALFHALCTIFSHSFLASAFLVTIGASLSIGNFCVYSLPSIAHCMNSSSSFTDTLAPVILPSCILASINASLSGCFTLIESIRAPRRPSCATSRVELLKRSMNGTTPVEVSAELFTGVPFGRSCERSWPTPPRRFISCTCSSSMSITAP